MKFLSYDSPFGKIGTMIFDLIWLQILFLITSIPLITAGASFTAMHSVVLKLYRENGGSVTRDYFRAFKENFRQGTLLWLLYLAAIFILVTDYLVASRVPDVFLRTVLQLLPIPLIALGLTLNWVFVLLSRYQNSIGQTLKNAVVLTVSRPLTSIGMLLIAAVPVALLFFVPNLMPLVLFMGITAAAYMRATLYSRIFDQLEGTDWRKEAAKELAEAMQE